MIVVGVDPGTAVSGYGVVEQDGAAQPRLLECGVIRTDASRELSARLADIYDGIAGVIERHQPDSMAIEGVFYARNVRTTVVLGHARGVILLAAEKNSVPVFEYPPREVKKSVAGTGSATKEQIQFMLAKLLRLRSAPEPHDAADGVAVALAHLQSARLAELVASGESGAGSAGVRANGHRGGTSRRP